VGKLEGIRCIHPRGHVILRCDCQQERAQAIRCPSDSVRNILIFHFAESAVIRKNRWIIRPEDFLDKARALGNTQDTRGLDGMATSFYTESINDVPAAAGNGVGRPCGGQAGSSPTPIRPLRRGWPASRPRLAPWLDLFEAGAPGSADAKPVPEEVTFLPFLMGPDSMVPRRGGIHRSGSQTGPVAAVGGGGPRLAQERPPTDSAVGAQQDPKRFCARCVCRRSAIPPPTCESVAGRRAPPPILVAGRKRWRDRCWAESASERGSLRRGGPTPRPKKQVKSHFRPGAIIIIGPASSGWWQRDVRAPRPSKLSTFSRPTARTSPGNRTRHAAVGWTAKRRSAKQQIRGCGSRRLLLHDQNALLYLRPSTGGGARLSRDGALRDIRRRRPADHRRTRQGNRYRRRKPVRCWRGGALRGKARNSEIDSATRGTRFSRLASLHPEETFHRRASTSEDAVEDAHQALCSWAGISADAGPRALHCTPMGALPLLDVILEQPAGARLVMAVARKATDERAPLYRASAAPVAAGFLVRHVAVGTKCCPSGNAPVVAAGEDTRYCGAGGCDRSGGAGEPRPKKTGDPAALTSDMREPRSGPLAAALRNGRTGQAPLAPASKPGGGRPDLCMISCWIRCAAEESPGERGMVGRQISYMAPKSSARH